MSAVRQHARPARQVRAGGRTPAGLVDVRRTPERLVFAVPLAAGCLGMAVALATMLTNATDVVIGPLLLLLAASMAGAFVVERGASGRLDRPAIVLAVLALIAVLPAFLLPVWMFGLDINGIVHRTVVSGPLLLVLGIAGAALSIRRLFSGSPSGQDLALVPVFTAPLLIGVVGFGFVLAQIVVSGASKFRWEMLTTAWGQVPGTGDYQIGYLNNILGTFLLITLTLLFALLPGVGAGVFMSSYPGRAARVIDFCSTMLRAIAVFIIGAAAIGVVHVADSLNSDSFLSLLIRGGWDDGTRVQAQKGSFVLAAIFMAVLVMPVIARLTEEGLRSVPREMREGSVALGATDGYGLRRILLPWAMPNILTAIILAGAEAAGSLAVIWFIAGTGAHGVNLFTNVTDMDFAVFAATYGPRDYVAGTATNPQAGMIHYQATAALLLLVLTVALTLIAMVLQRRFAKRYRGGLTG